MIGLIPQFLHQDQLSNNGKSELVTFKYKVI